MNNLGNDTLLKMSPENLLDYLTTEYFRVVPDEISLCSIGEISSLLTHFRNAYAYLTCLSMYANLLKREAKRNKEDKLKIEECTQREDYIKTMADIMNKQYESLSRKVTVNKLKYDLNK